MTLKNINVIHEMTEVFERMHAKLDQRFQKLLRQVNSHSNSTNYSQNKSKFKSIKKLTFDFDMNLLQAMSHLFFPLSMKNS